MDITMDRSQILGPGAYNPASSGFFTGSNKMFEHVLGPMGRGQPVDPHEQTKRSIYDLPAAKIEKSAYLGDTYVDLFRTAGLNNWVVDDVFPWYYTNDILFTWFQLTNNAHIFHQAPERSRVKRVTVSRAKRRAKLYRVGLGVEWEIGFMQTAVGVENYWHSVNILVRAWQERANLNGVRAIMNHAVHQRRIFWETYDGSDDVFEAYMEEDRYRFMILQKDPHGYEKWDDETDERMMRAGARRTPDRVILQRCMSKHLTFAHTARWAYYLAGPLGPARTNKLPLEEYHASKGSNNPPIDRIEPVGGIYDKKVLIPRCNGVRNSVMDDLFGRFRRVGEYYMMCDPEDDDDGLVRPNRYHYRSADRNITVFNMDEDVWSNVRFVDAIEHLPIWQPNGDINNAVLVPGSIQGRSTTFASTTVARDIESNFLVRTRGGASGYYSIDYIGDQAQKDFSTRNALRCGASVVNAIVNFDPRSLEDLRKSFRVVQNKIYNAAELYHRSVHNYERAKFARDRGSSEVTKEKITELNYVVGDAKGKLDELIRAITTKDLKQADYVDTFQPGNNDDINKEHLDNIKYYFESLRRCVGDSKLEDTNQVRSSLLNWENPAVAVKLLAPELVELEVTVDGAYEPNADLNTTATSRRAVVDQIMNRDYQGPNYFLASIGSHFVENNNFNQGAIEKAKETLRLRSFTNFLEDKTREMVIREVVNNDTLNNEEKVELIRNKYSVEKLYKPEHERFLGTPEDTENTWNKCVSTVGEKHDEEARIFINSVNSAMRAKTTAQTAVPKSIVWGFAGRQLPKNIQYVNAENHPEHPVYKKKMKERRGSSMGRTVTSIDALIGAQDYEGNQMQQSRAYHSDSMGGAYPLYADGRGSNGQPARFGSGSRDGLAGTRSDKLRHDRRIRDQDPTLRGQYKRGVNTTGEGMMRNSEAAKRFSMLNDNIERVALSNAELFHQIATVAYLCLRFNKFVFYRLIKYDIRVALTIMAVRAAITLFLFPVIKLVAGCGVTAAGNINVMVGNDAERKIGMMGVTGYMGPIVQYPQDIWIGWDMFCRRYHGGMGVGFFTDRSWNAWNTQKNGQRGPPNGQSILAIPLPYNMTNPDGGSRGRINLSGRQYNRPFATMNGENTKAGLDYPTATMMAGLLQTVSRQTLKNRNNIALNKNMFAEGDRRSVPMNDTLYPGSYYRSSIISNHQMQFVPGRGHLGSVFYTGIRAIFDGQCEEIKPDRMSQNIKWGGEYNSSIAAPNSGMPTRAY